MVRLPGRIGGLILATVMVSAAHGQSSGAAASPYVSSAEAARLIARAKAMRQPGQALVVQTVRQAAPYAALLEYRVAGTPPIVHECDSELFFVVAGSGTMMLGGSLVAPRQVNLGLSRSGEPVPDVRDPAKVAASANWSGTGAVGGRMIVLKRGDVVIVPPDTVHWFNRVNGNLAMVSLHAVLRPVMPLPAVRSGRANAPRSVARPDIAPISERPRSERCPIK